MGNILIAVKSNRSHWICMWRSVIASLLVYLRWSGWLRSDCLVQHKSRSWVIIVVRFPFWEAMSSGCLDVRPMERHRSWWESVRRHDARAHPTIVRNCLTEIVLTINSLFTASYFRSSSVSVSVRTSELRVIHIRTDRPSFELMIVASVSIKTSTATSSQTAYV
jgi:hypothetical protein